MSYFIITITLITNRLSTVKSKNKPTLAENLDVAIKGFNVIGWNKAMSAHELKEICQTKLLTKHFSLTQIYLVVCRGQMVCLLTN